MNNIQIFRNNDFGIIRTVTIENEPWFVGKDVAEVLGYSDTNKAVVMHVDEEDKKLNDKSSPSFGQHGSTRLTITPKVTGKGQVYFVNKILKEGL